MGFCFVVVVGGFRLLLIIFCFVCVCWLGGFKGMTASRKKLNSMIVLSGPILTTHCMCERGWLAVAQFRESSTAPPPSTLLTSKVQFMCVVAAFAMAAA